MDEKPSFGKVWRRCALKVGLWTYLAMYAGQMILALVDVFVGDADTGDLLSPLVGGIFWSFAFLIPNGLAFILIASLAWAILLDRQDAVQTDGTMGPLSAVDADIALPEEARMTNPITSTLDAGQQKIAGDALQETVVDLIDLSLIGKQAHWSVIGKNFRSVHLALDELVTAAREFTDAAAERATAIGVSPDGRAATVAAESGAKGIDAGWTKDDDVTNAVVVNLAVVVERLRRRVKDTADADPVTQDLLIEITARLEQLHWMWQAQSA